VLDSVFSWSDGLLLGAKYSTPTTKTTTFENQREKDIRGKRERQTKKDKKREKIKFLKEQDTQKAPI